MMHADTTRTSIKRLDARAPPPPRAWSMALRRSVWRAAGAAFTVLAFAGPGLAQPVRITWSTYLRTGPGSGYAVVDELQHDTLVDLRTCGVHWCQILSGRTVGYVDKDSITLPRLPSGAAPVGGVNNCFVTGQYAWRTPAKTRFCQTKPAG